ncbi:MAG: glutamate-5-semialdehyde dehydrogenase [Alphaproteobacteria bacterium]
MNEMVSHTDRDTLVKLMKELGENARRASQEVANASDELKSSALRSAAQMIRQNAQSILAANSLDISDAETRGTKGAFLDRLKLDSARLEAIAKAVDDVAALHDPVGRVLAEWTQPNGLRFQRVATPLGVIGVIFESRPNVTADAAALCVKSGNATILRAGSESFRTSMEIADAMRAGYKQIGLTENAIQLVPTKDRDAVGMMLAGLNGMIDVIVPRGGKGLVGRVQEEARVPIFAHLEGICHVYVHAKANLAMAEQIVLNAKLRRTGVCGAAETLLIDQAVISTHLKPLVTSLLDKGCAVRGDSIVQKADPRVTAASEEDWHTEYLDSIIAVKVVAGLDDAISRIGTYGSHHTESIITDDQHAADEFLKRVDSAIVLHNASTQFADGGEFGFGAEIGIATGRMHARGPVGIDQLCSFKYRVYGSGQIRP